MKKFAPVFLFFLFACAAFAQSSTEEKDDYFYINVPIVRVYDHLDAYIVNYQKGSMGIGEVCIPKEWFTTNLTDKCRVRPLPRLVQPYMTVIFKGGALKKIYLTMPTDRRDPSWKILSKDVDISSKMNKDISTLKVDF
ncbi:MAG: hypothetical protein ACTTHG_01570 [Treponemataceae bacterium]